jgi:lycopene beta-cyclase
LAIIESNARVQLMLGQETLSSPTKTKHGWYIKTGDLEITAKQVLDTRPPKKIRHDDSVLWQSFVGYEIQAQTDYFSPEKMVLMEFDEDFKEGLGFVYILPTTENKALVEYTVFSENRFLKDQLITNLEKSISKKTNGQKYEVLRVEHGILPMGYQSAKKEKDSTYLHAGLFSGAARPSSGYAFQRIQSWAKKCAHSLIAKNSLCPFPKEPRLQSFMDELFLNVIQKNPTMAASLFEDLFKKCDLKTVIKFMSDQATICDYFRIVISLPPPPFLRALPHFLFQKIYSRFRSIS